MTLPRVVLHNEVSIDGRMDTFSADMGLYYGLAGHWKAQAMLSGSATMLAAFPPDEGDAPQEEAPAPPARDPDEQRQWLVIVDSRGRLRGWPQIRNQPYWRDVIVLCSRATPQAYVEDLHKREIEHIVAGEDGVDLQAALAELRARYGVELVRVDSGGVLNGALLREGLVHEISLILSPYLVGGTTPRSFFVAPDLSSEEGVIDLRLTHVERVEENTLWLRYEIVR
jgi:2,5-diamino-6-(ribosylamino)-4(3H)-pyrimidinone 5'-phosphate reductase